MQETWVRSLGWKSPWRGKSYSLLYFGLENSMDCMEVHGIARSQTGLSDSHFQDLSSSHSQWFPQWAAQVQGMTLGVCGLESKILRSREVTTERPSCQKFQLCRNGSPQDKSGLLMEREALVSQELQPSINGWGPEADFVPFPPCLVSVLLCLGSWLSSLPQLLKSPEHLVPTAQTPQSLLLSGIPARPKSSEQFSMVQACWNPVWPAAPVRRQHTHFLMGESGMLCAESLKQAEPWRTGCFHSCYILRRAQGI